MKSKFCLLAIIGLGLVLPTGCSEDASGIYIIAFGKNRIPLQVGQEDYLTVELSEKVTAKSYVDIDNSACPNNITVVPASALKYNVGDDKQTVTIKGVKSTNNAYCKIKFNLRDTFESRTFEVLVKGTVIPDSGPQPDMGDVDQGTPDTGTPDSGGDTGASDASDASTPDAAAADAATAG